MNHYATTPEYRARRRHRAALVAFIAVAIVAVGLIATDSHAQTSSAATSWQAPRCAEDQVISKRGRCLDHDDRTTRFQRVSEAGWGYWYDSRYPRARTMRALVPACHRWQMLTRWGGCVAIPFGEFFGGWWYHR